MADPLTLSVLSAAALTKGIDFLYGQASEILKSRRERKREEAQVLTPGECDVLDGALSPARVEPVALERFGDDIAGLQAALREYISGDKPVDPSDEALLRLADALRRTLELVLAQRITFVGEQRQSAGTVIRVESEADDVAGYSASVRARYSPGSIIEVKRRTGVVRPGGEDVGVDLR